MSARTAKPIVMIALWAIFLVPSVWVFRTTTGGAPIPIAGLAVPYWLPAFVFAGLFAGAGYVNNFLNP